MVSLKNIAAKSMAVIIILTILITSLELYYVIIQGFVPIPPWMRRIYHTVISPPDLLNPIVESDFDFFTEGYTKTFELKPKYLDLYCIGFKTTTGWIPNSYTFDGVINANFYYKDNLVASQNSSVIYAISDKIDEYNKLCFMHFWLPMDNQYLRDTKVTLRVVKPSSELLAYKKILRLIISVSSY